MDLKKSLGKEITHLRLNLLQLTQKELSEKLGISVVYISYLEMGRKTPSLELLEKLYNLVGEKAIPDNIRTMLSDIKQQTKKELTDTKIKRLLDDPPSDPSKIYEILESLVEKGMIKEAKNYILKSLITVKKVQERKLLEALYYELEGNFVIAIKLMKEAMESGNE